MSKFSAIKDFEIQWKQTPRGRVCRFAIDPRPEYEALYEPGGKACTRWYLPAYNKSKTKFDRFFLLKLIEELFETWAYPILGSHTPAKYSYQEIAPTSGGVLEYINPRSVKWRQQVIFDIGVCDG